MRLARIAPGVAVLVLAAVLAHRDTPAATIALFTAYVALGITLPGVVLWRLATRRRRDLVEDLSAGFLLGAAVQILVYLAVSPLGLQRWAWLWFVPVVLTAAAVPRLREVWLAPVTEPSGVLTGWLVAAASVLPQLVVYANGPARFTPPYQRPDVTVSDMAYHQALVASARHDFPLRARFLDGEPLDYHYFVHELIASISWATGIDPTHLLYTLVWWPLALAGCGLTVALARRLRPDTSWLGPLAVVVAGIGGTLQWFGDVPVPAEMVSIATYLSPTQNLGAGFALLLSLLAVDVLRAPREWRLWLALGVTGLASTGAKASVLPVVLCGFGLVLLVRRRKVALFGTVLCGVLLVLATVVLFGGASYGTTVRPGRLFARIAVYRALHGAVAPDISAKAELVTAVAVLAAWLLATAGLLVLVFTRAVWRDDAVVFLAGCSVGGFAGMVLTDHPGVSQLYFHRTALPMIALLSCLGLALLLDKIHAGATPWLATALLAGLVAAAFARLVAEQGPPRTRLSTRDIAGAMLTTVAILAAAVILVAAAWLLVRRGAVRTTVVLPVVAIAVLTAAGVLPALQSTVTTTGATAALFQPREQGGPTRDATAAAHWLRDHSGTGDLVATNAHCVRKFRTSCDSRHFWIAALTERQVLIEGWSYTGRTMEQASRTSQSAVNQPYWDPLRLADNDAAFARPSAETTGRLRDRYGVRWLYADMTYSLVPPELARYATLRFSRPGVRIYELP